MKELDLGSVMGPPGETGAQGMPGKDGKDGESPTVSIGSVITGEPGSNASVTNTGDDKNVVLNFTIPKGASITVNQVAPDNNGNISLVAGSIGAYTKEETKNLLSTKQNAMEGMGLSSNDFTDAEKDKLAGLENYNDSDLSSRIDAEKTKNLAQDAAIAGKVDKVSGKGLSSNDYTSTDKTSLSDLAGTVRTSETSLFVGGGGKTNTGAENVAVGNEALLSSTTGKCNTAIGFDALKSNTTSGYNTAVGNGALFNNTGSYNTASGAQALVKNTTGENNTAMGSSALYNNTTASYNTAMGRKALYNNTTGGNNIAVGFQALFCNDAGCCNTAIGDSVLCNNTTGANNTATGRAALYNNTTASSNTAMGYYALYGNTIGDSNTACGYNALKNNVNGNANAACGSWTLFSNTSGSHNVAAGTSALYNNTTGAANTAIGREALSKNTTGGNNIAIGYRALYSNISGGSNTAIGDSALYSNANTGNTATGQRALYSNTTGGNNTANGINALTNSTTSYSNTAMGANALGANTTGSYNTAVGAGALYNKQDGSLNTAFSNCVGLGQNTRVSGDRQVQLGESGTTTYAYGAVQNRSDARDKTDIRDTELGLAFINALRPVDFRWNYRDDYLKPVQVMEYTVDEDGPVLENNGQPAYECVEKLLPTEQDGSKARKRYHHGLIAQEVKQVMDNFGVDFGGYQDHSINGGCDVLSIGYTELIAPMIKAIQEQQKQIEELTQKVNMLEVSAVYKA